MPTCYQCKKYKLPKHFHKDDNKKNGCSSYCKKCAKDRQQEYSFMSGAHKALKKDDERRAKLIAESELTYIKTMPKTPDLDSGIDTRRQFLNRLNNGLP